MNIMFFLKPKAEVSFLYDYNTVIKGLELMKQHSYTAIPVIDREGRYVGTVTHGDFLWKLYDLGSVENAASDGITIREIMSKGPEDALGTNASVDDVLDRAMGQNFVPVVDGRNMFIGIVTRRDIIRYFRDINGQL